MSRIRLSALPLALALGACTIQRATPDGATRGLFVASDDAQPGQAIAPGNAEAAARLLASPRHGEWVMIAAAPGSRDSIAAWVVYPERKTIAPVVVVIHEIFGLSTWVRSVADQLAADGFIAVAPDLLSIERGGATTDTLAYDVARAMIGKVTPDKMNAMVAAVAKYGMSLPAAAEKYGGSATTGVGAPRSTTPCSTPRG